MADLIPTLTASLGYTYSVDRANSNADPGVSETMAYEAKMTDGTGDDQADELWNIETTVGIGGATDYDLTALTDAFGDTLTGARVKAILFENVSANDAVLTLGASGGFEWAGAGMLFAAVGDAVVIPDGGVFSAGSPEDSWPVTNGASDLLRVGGDGVLLGTYKLTIVLASA